MGRPRSKCRYCASRGDVGAFLPLAELLVLPVLRAAALQSRPDPRDEGDAPSVRHPLEVLDAGKEVALALGLAARGVG